MRLRTNLILTACGIGLFAALSLAQMRVDGLPKLLGRNPTIFVGTGTANPVVGGVLTVSTTQAATGADTNETDLWTYSLPANTLSANGKGLRITIWGTTGATANNKTLKAYLGTTLVLNQTTALNGGRWIMDVLIVRTTAVNAQNVLGGGMAGSSLFAPALTAGAEDLSSTATIKMSGTNGTAAANDIVFRGAILETLN